MDPNLRKLYIIYYCTILSTMFLSRKCTVGENDIGVLKMREISYFIVHYRNVYLYWEGPQEKKQQTDTKK